MWLPLMAAATEDWEFRSAVAHSTPLEARALAAGLVMSRVMPRILKAEERVGSARMALIIEPPWLPVAPKTVMSLYMVCDM